LGTGYLNTSVDATDNWLVVVATIVRPKTNEINYLLNATVTRGTYIVFL